MSSFRSSPFRCGGCEFTSECVNERTEHRMKEHPTRFNVHGRCGICQTIYSDLFSYLDHFEETHSDQFEILVEKGIEMMRYRTPCPLLFVFRTYIKKDGDAQMDFTDKETLHRLVRSVVYELGMSASDSESDEEDIDDGDDPPSSPSPQPPDRPFSPFKEITTIEVKQEKPSEKTEETLCPDSSIMDNCSHSESVNTYPKSETTISEHFAGIKDTSKPIHCTTITNQIEPSRGPISELQRLLDSPIVPIDQYHQREANHQEQLRIEKEQQEKNERMQLIERQNKRGRSSMDQLRKRSMEQKQQFENHKNDLRKSIQSHAQMPSHQPHIMTRPQTLPHHQTFTTQNQIPPSNLRLLSPNVPSMMNPSQYGTPTTTQFIQSLSHSNHTSPTTQYGFTPSNGLPGIPIQNQLPMMVPPQAAPMPAGVELSPGVYPLYGRDGMPVLTNMIGTTPSTMQQYQMQQFVQQQQQIIMHQNNQQRMFMQQHMQMQLQQLQQEQSMLHQAAMASSAMENSSTITQPIPPQFFTPSNKPKRRSSDELPKKRTHAKERVLDGDKKKRVETFVDGMISEETKVPSHPQPSVIVNGSIESVSRPTVLPTDSNPLLIKTDIAQDSMVASPKSGFSNASLPSIHSPLKIEEKVNLKCEQECQSLEITLIVSPSTTLEPQEKTSPKIEEEKDKIVEEAPVLLSPSDPPGKTDQDFWSGKSPSRSCPRGCGFVGETKAQKQNHYKKCHYAIFYVVEKGMKAKQENWFEQNLGCSSQGDRVCLHCPSSSSNLFKKRSLLLLHIREMHPQNFVEMSGEYLAIPMKRGETPLYRQLDELLREPLPSLIFVQSSVDKNTSL